MSNQVILPEQQPEFPPYVWYSKLFSPPECVELIRIGESMPLEKGAIGNGMNNQTQVNEDYRCVETSPIEVHHAPWAYDRLRERIEACNKTFFRFDLHGLYERLVFLKYRAAETSDGKPGKYDWHQDIGGGMSSLRKLSVVSQLSSPEEYDGCRLRLFSNMDFDPDHTERGDTIVFPSYLPHCVTPITRGVRYALVAWVTGPQFR